MLAVMPLMNGNNERESEMEGFSMEENIDFADFSGGNLLDSIDFDDLFVGISDGDVLPDLEMDPEILAEFSVGGDGGNDESELNIPSSDVSNDEKSDEDNNNNNNNYTHSNNGSSTKLQEKVGAASTASVSLSSSSGDEIVSKRDSKPAGVHNNSNNNNSNNSSPKEPEKGRKSMANSKNPPGKRKVKVDWTPELHRRFVQAVEQLGVDKAVPSRILELMGIDCLTRHNIASHLQKYRSHRKHLLAREAEAASWSQRRQMYGGGGGGAAAGKRDHPWISAAPPTIGFPPAGHVAPMPHPHFRPLHVWGHPSVDQSLMHMWPKHLTPSPPPHAWPPPPPHDPSFWVSHPQHVATPGTPCFPPPHLPPTRFATPALPGIPPPPPPMYKVEPGGLSGVPPGQTLPQPPSDIHPSKESVDAAIGDVLTKPWLPLPLGLKPPSTDSVMVELQRQGISKIPPTCA